MRTALKVLAAVSLPLFALGGARSGLASSMPVVAPGRLDAQTIPVVTTGCWTGAPTFTPTQAVGNPKTFKRLQVSGAPGAFAGCAGQYADVSVTVGGDTQIDLARDYPLGSADANGFTLQLVRGTLTAPVPAGTSFTLVVHT